MGRWVSVVFMLIASAVGGSPYQKLTIDIPAELPGGIKDSTLRAWGSPIATRPPRSARMDIKPVVWERITVGAKGKVVASEAVYTSHKNLGLEDAAKDALKKALFYAVWDGPNPVEYRGYFPVTFAPVLQAKILKSPHFEVDRTLNLMTVKKNGQLIIGAASPAQYKSISEYVGRDAPIVNPVEPSPVVWPEKLRDSIREAIAWLKVRIGTDGKVVSSEPFFFLEDLPAFEKAAAKAVKKSTFPLYHTNGKNRDYDAYVPVPFVHAIGDFRKLGLPEPDEPIKIDRPPSPQMPTTIQVLPALDQAGMYGTVEFRLLIDTLGRVLTSRIEKSSGFVELDRFAEHNANRFSFQPATKGEQTLPAWTKLTLDFVPITSQVPTMRLEDAPAVFQDKDRTPTDNDSLPAPGEFLPLDEIPTVKREARAEYPKEARDAGLTGKVMVYALVGKDGRVIECRIARSSGVRSLDEAAKNALFQFTFTPGIQNGKPVKCWISKVFTFTIN